MSEDGKKGVGTPVSPSGEGKKEHELFEQRLASAQKWRDLGASPFGNGFRPEHLAADILVKHVDA
jgi:lysyl-tRNA synthetase class 2